VPVAAPIDAGLLIQERRPDNKTVGGSTMSHLAHHRFAVAVFAGLCAFAAPPALAQMPPDIAARIAALGRVVDPTATAAIYAPLQESEPYAGIKVARDVKYGPSDRNLLDVFSAEGFAAAGPSDARPVLMFMHGGRYTRGDKRRPGSPFYDNIMLFAARHGMVGVNLEYRLAPKDPWPAAVEDLAAAVRFVAGNVNTYGGNPGRIFLMGHSAGATHVATYVAHKEFHGPKGSGLAGAMLSSGIYDLSKAEPTEERVAYFGADSSRYAERSALPGLIDSNVPFMISSAELDPPAMVEQFNLLREAMCKSERGCIRAVALPHHSHMSESYSINTADTQLSNQILEFIEKGR
jgi:acetyl esterase/lipase